MTPLASEKFEQFTGEHALIGGLFLLGAVVFVWLGRSHRGTSREVAFRRWAALAMVPMYVVQQVRLFLPDHWDIDVSLPVHLCDLVWPLAIWALWTRRPLASALVYFWGLSLSIQGILTPSLDSTYPEFSYFLFWMQHFTIVWSALYLAFGIGVHVTWRTYRLSLLVTVVWAVLAMAFNFVADTNYGYLRETPSEGSLLDLFGPWPIYILVSLGVLMVGWAGMTWLARALEPESRACERAHGVSYLRS